MKSPAFAFDVGDVPRPADAERARVAEENWLDAIEKLGDGATRDAARALAADGNARRLLEAVFGNSAFLSHMAEREPGFFTQLLVEGPDPALAWIEEEVGQARAEAIRGIDPASALRRAKRKIALSTAIADMTNTWSLEAVTHALSWFADAALGCAAAFLLKQIAARGAIELVHADDPERASGLIILGMGKLGAHELNYSSDIDIIIFYDPETIVTSDRDGLQQHFVRLARGLVRIMAERTAEGYVFRTDLRLRPDPSSTPPAMSVLAAEVYYETLGQNWERAAFIKARPVAGDLKAGEQFLRHLRPYIWRKNLDFAAIQDIHSIKRQINAHRGGGKIAVAGHNIKTGRGGIREVEFFAQTQQLIWGGRLPELRLRGTVETLTALAAVGQIDPATRDDLINAYRRLRRIEHRLQMTNDEQTHDLPSQPQGLTALATFLGYDMSETFTKDVLGVFRTVESHYAELFEDAPALALGEIGGNLVFTGGDPDPGTLETLGRLGFADVHMIDSVVRNWHRGRYRAMRSTRARELLTELMPALLKTLADTPSPDATFLAFDRFLQGLPAGVQLFSMIHAQPLLLEYLTDILGVAPRLAQHLTQQSSLLESVLTADFFKPPADAAVLLDELEAVVADCDPLEEVFDESRRWVNDRKFQIGVQSLRGMLDGKQAGAAWSTLADVTLRALAPCVEEEFARAHGRISGGGMAVLGLGKLGGEEMNAGSDLDMIFVYTADPDATASDGAKPLTVSQYYARLSQRLINALAAPTKMGSLYEVDMRLRPSGTAGPIATSFAAFKQYHFTEAWTWERMAISRARAIMGPPWLVADVNDVIRSVLTERRNPERLLRDVADMRQKIDEQHHTESLWNVKYLRGGLVDIEFLAQYLQLRHARDAPDILSPNTFRALARTRRAGLLNDVVAEDLLEALSLWHAVQGRLRLTLIERPTGLGADDSPESVRRALDGCAGLDFATLVARMKEAAIRSHAHFVSLIEEPARRTATDDAAAVGTK